MVEVVKQTRQRFTRPKHSGDIELDAQGTEALSQEAIIVLGGWTDSDGTTGGIPTKQQMFGTIADELFGTNAWLEGARLSPSDSLGNNLETTRLRQKRITIK